MMPIPMAEITSTPTPNRNLFSSMLVDFLLPYHHGNSTAALSGGQILGHFVQSFSRLAADKLPNSTILGMLQLARWSLEQYLGHLGLQSASRVEHQNAIGDFSRGSHIVRDDETRHRVAASGVENQFIDNVAHDRI